MDKVSVKLENNCFLIFVINKIGKKIVMLVVVEVNKVFVIWVVFFSVVFLLLKFLFLSFVIFFCIMMVVLSIKLIVKVRLVSEIIFKLWLKIFNVKNVINKEIGIVVVIINVVFKFLKNNYKIKYDSKIFRFKLFLINDKVLWICIEVLKFNLIVKLFLVSGFLFSFLMVRLMLLSSVMVLVLLVCEIWM